MKFHIEIDENELKSIVIQAITEKTGGGGSGFKPENVKIEVKSKQNYRSEWEEAAFRATLDARA